MQNTQVDLSIIVVAWNVKELCDECFRAIAKSTDTLVKEILFVDNGSVDGTADYVEATFPEVILIRSPTNLGFIRANNLAYKQARGKYILMLNSDAFVFEETLQVSVDFMEQHPEAGVMGGRLIGRDGVLQPSARYFPTPFKSFLNQIGLLGKIPFVGVLDDLTWDHQTVRECDWVVGCYLLTRKDIIDRMGYFLREDFFMYNDDNDLCYRIKQMGYKTYYVPTDVIHLGGATAKKNMGKVSKRGTQVVKLQLESQLIYYRKNYHIGTALSNVFFLLLLDILFVFKLFFTGKNTNDDTVKDLTEHMKLVFDIGRKTGWGAKSIH